MIEKNIIQYLIESLTDVIFPNVCGICGKLDEKSLCKKCEMKLQKLKNINFQDFRDQNYNELISIFSYEGIIRSNILNYKFKDKAYMAKTFAKFITNEKNVFEKIKTYDTIIPVPISKERMKQRGYNQSLIIAKELNKYLNLELVNNSLIKTKNVVEQSSLNKEERQKNIINAYELKNRQILENKKVLIIDDIYTTGSTVNECAKMIRLAKPEKIGVLAFAKVTND